MEGGTDYEKEIYITKHNNNCYQADNSAWRLYS